MFAIKSAFCLVIAICLSTFASAATNSCKFKRGDSDGSGVVDITDVQHILAYAYQGGAAPPNLDAADADDNGSINNTDSTLVHSYLFLGGAAPPDPGPTNADCDPTTGDNKEQACTPVGTWTVASGSAAASVVVGSPFDCNVWGVQANPRFIDIHAENSETMTEPECSDGEPTDVITGNLCCDFGHDACNHNDTRTRWTFTWNIGSSPAVERLAFNTGCTKLHVKLDWRADFDWGGPCGQPGGGCPGGDDLLSWKPENEQIEFHFRNQTTSEASIQKVTWYNPFILMAATSVSQVSGPPCVNTITEIPDRNRDIHLSTVTWSGNHEWKLEKVVVKFIATFFRNTTADNADIEIIKKYVSAWSVYLETIQYQNL